MFEKIRPFENVGGYTTFSNNILDYIMPICKANTWKVICITLRKTIGWEDKSSPTGRKERDVISLSQYEKLMGTSRPTTIEAIQDAMDQGFIIRVPDGISFSYSINKEYELSTQSSVAQGNTDDSVSERNINEEGSKETLLVKNLDHDELKYFTSSSKETLPKLVKKFDTQNKEIKLKRPNIRGKISPKTPFTAEAETFENNIEEEENNYWDSDNNDALDEDNSSVEDTAVTSPEMDAAPPPSSTAPHPQTRKDILREIGSLKFRLAGLIIDRNKYGKNTGAEINAIYNKIKELEELYLSSTTQISGVFVGG